MTKEMKGALSDCLGELYSARNELDYADDQDDEFLVAVHWVITDVINDIEKALK